MDEISPVEQGIIYFILSDALSKIEDFAHIKILDLEPATPDFVSEQTQMSYLELFFQVQLGTKFFPCEIFLHHSYFASMAKKNKDYFAFAALKLVTKDLEINLKSLKCSVQVVKNIKPFDMVFFNEKDLTFQNGSAKTLISAPFLNGFISGSIVTKDEYYHLKVHEISKFDGVKKIMEQVQTNDSLLFEHSPQEKKELALMSLEVKLDIRLARKKLSLKDFCSLKKDQLIPLNKSIHAPLDMVVEGKKVGTCQIVKIDNDVGIRVLSIVDG